MDVKCNRVWPGKELFGLDRKDVRFILNSVIGGKESSLVTRPSEATSHTPTLSNAKVLSEKSMIESTSSPPFTYPEVNEIVSNAIYTWFVVWKVLGRELLENLRILSL